MRHATCDILYFLTLVVCSAADVVCCAADDDVLKSIKSSRTGIYQAVRVNY